jgi:hypothetical protein
MTDVISCYTLTPAEFSNATDAVYWSLGARMDLMHEASSKLSPAARVEVLTCLSLLADTLRGLECRDVAAAALVPDSLPLGVEGFKVGGRL